MHAKRDPQPGRNIVLTLVRRRESAIFLALILLMTVIGIAAPNFLGAGNLYLVSRQISFVAIVALGELFVILTGGIDLSVGSVMALAGLGAGYSMTIGVPPPYAVLLGIDVKRIKFFLYLIPAACASIAGIILVARFNSAQADTGKGWELDAIAAAVIGGTSLAGGSGSVLGVLIGACIMGIIKNGLVLMRVSSYWQTAIIGIIIVLAAVLDRAKRRA